MKKYKVVALHYTNVCNLKCPFCYKTNGKEIMNKKLMMNLPEYLTQITGQVAVGGGEPLMFPKVIKEFADQCVKHKLVCNITSNGYLLDKFSDEKLKNILKNVTLISLSIDEYKTSNVKLYKKYLARVKRLRRLGKEVGANLLINKKMFENHWLIRIVDELFKHGVSRVYALHPKHFSLGVDIIKFKKWYMYLTAKHKHFYLDDCSNSILEGWKNPCHRGKGLI